MQDPQFFYKLHKGRQLRGITARVVRKWTIYDTSGDDSPLHIGMVLADGKGDAMYAHISHDLIDQKACLFEIGSVYVIKKFVVEDSRRTFKAVDKNLMIEITQYTSAELVRHPPSTIPQYIYTITPFTAIKVSKVVVKYTDVIGYIIKYDALHTFVPKNTEKTKMLREVYIKDLRENILKVTLWGEQAANFGLDAVYDKNGGNLIVCLIVGCIPRHEFRNNAKITLTGSPACSYYLNPEIPEAAPFHSRFKNIPVYIDEPAAPQQETAGSTHKVALPQKTIAQLEDIDPFDEQEPGPYKCTVTIVSIVNKNRWWYISCKQCKKKMDQQLDQTYRCPNPRCFETATVPRYTITFIAKDETGEAQFFAYDDEAQKMIQKECESVLGWPRPDGDLPQPIRNLIDKTYVFSVDLTNESCKKSNKRQYQIKAILQKPTKRAHTETFSAPRLPLLLGSSSTQNTEEALTSIGPKSVTQCENQVAKPQEVIQTPPEPIIEDAHHGYKHQLASAPKAAVSARGNLQQRFDAAEKVNDADASELTSAAVDDTRSSVQKRLKQAPSS